MSYFTESTLEKATLDILSCLGYTTLNANQEQKSYSDKVIVRRLLRKYGYPPDKQEKATETVLKQVEHLYHVRLISYYKLFPSYLLLSLLQECLLQECLISLLS